VTWNRVGSVAFVKVLATLQSGCADGEKFLDWPSDFNLLKSILSVMHQ